ncbi:MAG: BON domain-containing protein [Planctomycetia bacterium]|nr:BON domain-containing protein [Planctomycetia bacterium]
MRRVFLNLAVLVAAALIPMSAMGGNQEMAESIANVLENENLTDGCDIGLKYQKETVWLSGVVDDASKIEAIVNAVKSVDGVTEVVNRLEVEQKVVQDNEIQKVSFHEGQPEVLEDVAGAQIISDEVISVSGTEQAGVDAPIATALPPTPAAPAPMRATSQTVLQGKSTPVPLRKVSYGTTVKEETAPVTTAVPPAAAAPMAPMAPMTTSAPPQSYPSRSVYTENGGVQYGVPGQPLAMNPQAYNMQTRTSASMCYDQPHLPNKAWPSYAAYPYVAGIQYPKRHTHAAWPHIGPYYPYPQVPDGWRKVTLQWHDGYWHLDFDDGTTKGPFNGLFRQKP